MVMTIGTRDDDNSAEMVPIVTGDDNSDGL